MTYLLLLTFIDQIGDRTKVEAVWSGSFAYLDLRMSMPSATLPANPKAEPSQYMLNVHEVVGPSEPGAQTKMSAPSPRAPVTENAPTVLR